MLQRLRSSPRALGVTAVVAVLLAAAVLDVPGQLGKLAPDQSTSTSTPDAPVPDEPVETDPGELTNLVTKDNAGLDQCTPGSKGLAWCGRAPALGDGTWLNTPGGRPVSLKDLRGSVVIVDFFAGSCGSCRRDSRYLRAWEAQYGDLGLEVVGVHVPKFRYERRASSLARTLDRLSIRFPVLLDNGFSTITDYRSSVLPSKYLIDRTGTVRAITFGEGGYPRIENQIRTILQQSDFSGDLPSAIGELDDGADAEPGTTPQIDLGDSRGRRYDTESDIVVGDNTRFRLPDQQPDGTFSLGGVWRLRAEDATPRPGGVARVSFRARRAYQLVAGSGTLVVTTSQGVTRQIPVSGGPDLVQIYGAPTSDPETLTVAYEGDLRVYAFSFG